MSLVELKVPAIGESVTEVTLSKWLIGNGDYVNLDDPICEFESDKATLEFPAEAAGKLVWVAAEGDDLAIGAVVAKIDTSVSAGTTSAAPAPTPPTKAPAPVAATSNGGGIVEMFVPITEVTLSKWLVGNGEQVNLDDPICEFESDKATLEFPAEAAGKLTWVAAEGDDLAIGSLVAKIDTSVVVSNSAAKQMSAAPVAATTTSSSSGRECCRFFCSG